MEAQAATNKKLVKKTYEETWRTRNIETLASIISDDIRYHTPDRDIIGKDNYLKFRQEFINAFENGRITIEDQVAIEDKVSSRFYFSGKHVGTFMGIPATNKMVIFEGMDLIVIVNRMIIKQWEIYDRLGLARQLGRELEQKEYMH